MRLLFHRVQRGASRFVARLTGRDRAAAAAGRPGRARFAVFGAVALIAALIPFLPLQIPGVLPGSADIVNSAGTLEVLGLCFVFAAVALGFDVLFGFTGMLSFGQVRYFATGVYVLDAALSVWHWALLPAIGLTVVVGFALSVALGLISLRTRGIAFAMVTLAFAQAGYYLIEDDPHQLTGGATGLVMSTSRLPAPLVGVLNARDLYWLALAFLLLGLRSGLAGHRVGHRPGLAGDQGKRAAGRGARAAAAEVQAAVLHALLAAGHRRRYGLPAPGRHGSTGLGGLRHGDRLYSGPGRARRRGHTLGAVVGAIVYVYLQQYLLKVAAEPSFAALPAPLRVPLSQPEFLLGVIFVIFVLFALGGIAGLAARARTAITTKLVSRR